MTKLSHIKYIFIALHVYFWSENNKTSNNILTFLNLREYTQIISFYCKNWRQNRITAKATCVCIYKFDNSSGCMRRPKQSNGSWNNITPVLNSLCYVSHVNKKCQLYMLSCNGLTLDNVAPVYPVIGAA